MHPLTFLYKIESLTTFVWRHFWHNTYFWQHSAIKWIYFPISVDNNISKLTIVAPHSLVAKYPTSWLGKCMRLYTYVYRYLTDWNKNLWKLKPCRKNYMRFSKIICEYFGNLWKNFLEIVGVFQIEFIKNIKGLQNLPKWFLLSKLS